MLALYEELRKRILNLDPSIRIQYKKLYIAFKTSTNFVDVEPRKNRFVLYLNMRFDEIHDPKSLCRDVSNIGHWGNGDIEIGLSTMEQLDDVMYLVKQSYERHDDNEATTSQPGLWTTAEA
ncbi:MAG TPA: DUF5655 domain-containing protein [Herpetosiphonaceae bacterium]|nr:DUF5655 domain-containing protein [Herpetosiphonaceae bacterium]